MTEHRHAAARSGVRAWLALVDELGRLADALDLQVLREAVDPRPENLALIQDRLRTATHAAHALWVVDWFDGRPSGSIDYMVGSLGRERIASASPPGWVIESPPGPPPTTVSS